jgi:PAS domain S-box-containing protein
MGCTYVSDSWLAFTGRTLEEELGEGWAENVHPDDLARCLGIYQSAFHARREFQMQFRVLRHDGEYRWILDIGTPDWDAEGRFLGYIGSCLDVTKAHRLGAGPTDEDPTGTESAHGSVRPLTPREQDVVALLAGGLSNSQIATELVISAATVRVHVEHILSKLGLHSRAQVVAWSLRQQRRRNSFGRVKDPGSPDPHLA